MAAMHLSSENNTVWFPDTGATAHITDTSRNLTVSQPYLGNDVVMVGNSDLLRITHIGETVLKGSKSSIPVKDVLVVVSGPRIQHLKHELVTCTQKGMSIKAYYGKLKKLWEDLSDYDKEDQCICNTCSCDSKGRGARKREKDKVHQFLMGLDETSFGALKSSLLTRDPLPTLNQAFSIVQRDETMKIGNKAADIRPEVVGFAVQMASRGRGDYKDKICPFSGRKGHGEERCYAKNGYPAWWRGPRADAPATSKPEIVPSSAFNQVRGKSAAHSVGLIGPHPTVAASPTVTASTASVPGGFTDEQWQVLLNTFHSGKQSTSDTLTGPFEDADWSR